MVLVLVLIWAVLKSLNSYTRHGEVYIIPDFEGMHQSEVMERYGAHFQFIIIDSVYQRDAENGTIIMQNPSAGSKVKQGRNVYLTTIAQMPEQVLMPNLRNLSLRQAIVTLGLNGLHINELYFVEHFASNAVVEQEINGEVIEPETPVFKGTFIDLVIGIGGSSAMVPIPSIIGTKPHTALNLLHMASLNLGEEFYIDGEDTSGVRVYRTEPSEFRTQAVPIGEKINIWYRSETMFDFDHYMELIVNDTINADSLSILLNDPEL